MLGVPKKGAPQPKPRGAPRVVVVKSDKALTVEILIVRLSP